MNSIDDHFQHGNSYEARYSRNKLQRTRRQQSRLSKTESDVLKQEDTGVFLKRYRFPHESEMALTCDDLTEKKAEKGNTERLKLRRKPDESMRVGVPRATESNEVKKKGRKAPWMSYIDRISSDASKQRRKREQEGKRIRPAEIPAVSTDGGQRENADGTVQSKHPQETEVSSPKKSTDEERPSTMLQSETKTMREELGSELRATHQNGTVSHNLSSTQQKYALAIEQLKKLEERNAELAAVEVQLRQMNETLVSKLCVFRDREKQKRKRLAKHLTGTLSSGPSDTDSDSCDVWSSLKNQLSHFQRRRLLRFSKILFSRWQLFYERRMFAKLIREKRRYSLQSLVLRNWACWIMLSKLHAAALKRRVTEVAKRAIRKWEEFVWMQCQKRRNMEKARVFRSFNCWIRFTNISFQERLLRAREQGMIGAGHEDVKGKAGGSATEEKVIIPSVMKETQQRELMKASFQQFRSIAFRRLLTAFHELKQKQVKGKVFSAFQRPLLSKQKKRKQDLRDLQRSHSELKRKEKLLILLNSWKTLMLRERRKLITEKELAIYSLKNIYKLAKQDTRAGIETETEAESQQNTCSFLTDS